MTARELLRINGDGGAESPLVQAVRRFHRLLEPRGVAYCVIGGMAVVRNGWVRTTHDIDILVDRAGWESLLSGAPSPLEEAGITAAGDAAHDRCTGIDLDILFPGDDWEMVIPLPSPAAVREYDAALGAWFIGLAPLLAVKTAVYRSKLQELGPELAAKDLADVVELMRANRHAIDAALQRVPAAVSGELSRIWRRIRDR
jgi:hypothetical protein